MTHSAEEQRLLDLMAELVSRREYVSGDLPFPRTLDLTDAKAIAADLHAAVDLGTERRAEIAAKQGSPVFCHAGCSRCCGQLVVIWAPEAELIAEWLQLPEQAELLAWFRATYPTWEERSAEAIARVEERTAAGDAPGQYAALVAHWRQNILCAFNRDGLCTIYPVRPTICRHAHALETAERCRPDDKTGTAAVSLYFKPLEDFVRRARELSMSMHHALGRPRGQAEVLCRAVWERLPAV